jgi:hypothetical protein
VLLALSTRTETHFVRFWNALGERESFTRLFPALLDRFLRMSRLRTRPARPSSRTAAMEAVFSECVSRAFLLRASCGGIL